MPHFRPYGSYDRTTLRVPGDTGYARTALWDVDPSNYLQPGASVIAHRVVSAAHPGGIVIMHNVTQTARRCRRPSSDYGITICSR